MTRLRIRLAIVALACTVLAATEAVRTAPERGEGVPAEGGVNDEGWTIDKFTSVLDFDTKGQFVARESIDVDFGSLTKHGIFRDIVVGQVYDRARAREYPLLLLAVNDAGGRKLPVDDSANGGVRRLRIGDANVTVTGKQTYRIAYQVGQALNGFADHDELYWNVTGTWPARITAAAIVVRPPQEIGGVVNATCFQGAAGSQEACRSSYTDKAATFTNTRALEAGEQLTVVVFFRKGVFPAPQPRLHARLRDTADFFEAGPGVLAATGVLFAVVLAALGRVWWQFGRDRRFVSMHYLSKNPEEERVPLFSSDPIVVEFKPPDQIRPGQIGILIDESADTLDATATIIDLAARGYLTIKEIPKSWFLGSADWQLERLRGADPGLLEYERILLEGLFGTESSRKVSELKNTFYRTLNRAKDALYADAVSRGWFPRNPKTVMAMTMGAGFVVVVAGIFLGTWLGQRWGAALVAAPVVVGGFVLFIGARAMPRRSAAGREAMRRSLGFARYIKTAETHQQAFAERAVIFTQYLPYAIVFSCVAKWARAFQDIDLQRATAGFYTSSTAFDANNFSASLGGFSSSMSTAISSTPGGSGSSGSGGSSGGGGGGGGGGSW